LQKSKINVIISCVSLFSERQADNVAEKISEKIQKKKPKKLQKQFQRSPERKNSLRKIKSKNSLF